MNYKMRLFNLSKPTESNLWITFTQEEKNWMDTHYSLIRYESGITDYIFESTIFRWYWGEGYTEEYMNIDNSIKETQKIVLKELTARVEELKNYLNE